MEQGQGRVGSAGEAGAGFSKCCFALVVVLVLVAIAVVGGWLYLRGLVRRWESLKGALPGTQVVDDIGYTSYLPPTHLLVEHEWSTTGLPDPAKFDPALAAFALRACISAANRRLGGDPQLPPGVEVLNPSGPRPSAKTEPRGLADGDILSTDRALVLRIGADRRSSSLGAEPAASSNNLYLVAVSGTLSYEDLQGDLRFRQVDFYGTRAHSGFVDAWRKVYPGVRRVAESDPGARFFLSGHSLGGAVATLLAIALASDFPGARLALYATATPRTGPPGLVALLKQLVPNSWHVANRADLVPVLPPAVALVGVGRREPNHNAYYGDFARVVYFDAVAFGDRPESLASNHIPTTYLRALDALASQERAGGSTARPAGTHRPYPAG